MKKRRLSVFQLLWKRICTGSVCLFIFQRILWIRGWRQSKTVGWYGAGWNSPVCFSSVYAVALISLFVHPFAWALTDTVKGILLLAPFLWLCQLFLRYESLCYCTRVKYRRTLHMVKSNISKTLPSFPFVTQLSFCSSFFWQYVALYVSLVDF